jgi:hypothetical protein
MSGAALPPGLVVELVANPRSQARCACGSARPTIWICITREGVRRECCGACVERVWAEERLW